MKFYASFSITTQALLTSRAIAYGDGLFETALVVNGKIPLWDFHFERLSNGLRSLKMDVPSKAHIKDKIFSLILSSEKSNSHVVKLVVFRDDLKRGYGSGSSKINFFISLDSYNKAKVKNRLTVSSIVLSKQKNLAGLKHLNRMEQVLAANELIGSNYDDALMLNEKKHIIETISKNIILMKNGKLYTPKLNNCGVYGVALRWLQSQGFELKWKKIEFKSLHKYDAFIVCNSINGFFTIKKINNNFQFKCDFPLINEINLLWREQIDPI